MTNHERDQLKTLIPRIVDKYGSFKDLNERSLERDIGDSSGKENGPSSAAEVERSSNEENKSLQNLISTAQNEAGLALDFISLLLSSLGSKQATSTLSDFLKKQIPLESLSATHVEFAQADEPEHYKQVWKEQALGEAAIVLKRGADRISTELPREAKWWQRVLHIKECGWNICRIDASGSPLGVKYGFVDYVALLLRSENGEVQQQITPKRPLSLRIRCFRDGLCTGYAIKHKSLDDITMERDDIFEEELLAELTREILELRVAATTILEHGALKVRLSGFEFAVDLLDDTTIHESIACEKDLEDSKLAAFIMVMLQLLLSSNHVRLMQRRLYRHPTLPKSPFLAYSQHKHDFQSIYDFVSNRSKLLRSVGVEVSFSPENIVGLRESLVKAKTQSEITDAFLKDINSKILFSLPSHGQLVVNISTSVESSFFLATCITVTPLLSMDLSNKELREATFSDTDVVNLYLSHLMEDLLAKAIVRNIIQDRGSESAAKNPTSKVEVLLNEDSILVTLDDSVKVQSKAGINILELVKKHLS